MNLEIYRPKLAVARMSMINFPGFASMGKEYVIIDLDNTIALPGSCQIAPDARHAISNAQSMGFKFCILSNIGLGNQGLQMRLIDIAQELQAIPLGAYFPNLKQKVGPFVQAMTLLGSNVNNTIGIGDQITTDVVGGNRAGIYTILTQPLTNQEPVHIKLKRRLREKSLLKSLGISFS